MTVCPRIQERVPTTACRMAQHIDAQRHRLGSQRKNVGVCAAVPRITRASQMRCGTHNAPSYRGALPGVGHLNGAGIGVGGTGPCVLGLVAATPLGCSYLG